MLDPRIPRKVGDSDTPFLRREIVRTRCRLPLTSQAGIRHFYLMHQDEKWRAQVFLSLRMTSAAVFAPAEQDKTKELVRKLDVETKVGYEVKANRPRNSKLLLSVLSRQGVS